MTPLPRLAALSLVTACLVAPGCGRVPAQPAPAPALTSASSVPPSGTYTVSTRVVADECGTAAASEHRGLMIAAAVEAGVVTLDVPLPTGSMNGSPITARSNFTLGNPAGARETSPEPRCPGYVVTRRTELRNTGALGFDIVATTSYGDAGECGGAVPQRCTTSLVHHFALTEFACAAECSRGHRFVADPRGGPPQWHVECRCP